VHPPGGVLDDGADILQVRLVCGEVLALAPGEGPQTLLDPGRDAEEDGLTDQIHQAGQHSLLQQTKMNIVVKKTLFFCKLTSFVDPDPVGSTPFCWIQIRYFHYKSGSGSDLFFHTTVNFKPFLTMYILSEELKASYTAFLTTIFAGFFF